MSEGNGTESVLSVELAVSRVLRLANAVVEGEVLVADIAARKLDVVAQIASIDITVIRATVIAAAFILALVGTLRISEFSSLESFGWGDGVNFLLLSERDLSLELSKGGSLSSGEKGGEDEGRSEFHCFLCNDYYSEGVGERF